MASFDVLQHPSSSGNGAGEPTLGMDWESGKVLFMDGATAWRVDVATNSWTDVSPPNSITNIDPMLFTDLGTGRTFAGGLDGECSVMSFTDDAGESWLPAGNQCAGAFDHQTIGQGPWADPAPVQATYDRATYYCAQGWVNWPANACVVSWDGGIVYSPPISWEGPCFGLHGHVNVSSDGRAYVPTRSCEGVAGYAWTEDNGLSWQSKQHPAGMAAPGNGFDSSIGSSSDGNTLYFAFERNDWVPMVSRSSDDGATWTAPVAVGADAGIKTATFLRVVSGDPDRVALAYLGSTTDGNPFVSGWPGIWDLYVSYSYDGGATWSTVKVTTDPVQRGWMCAGGTFCASGRNLLDFIGHTLTPEGKLLVGFADGCVSACAATSGVASQSTAAWATIAVQRTGRGLYAEWDSASVEILGSLAGLAGAPVPLAATVSAALPYDATIFWGDGAESSLLDQTSTTLATEHVYAAAGHYDVTVLVTGSDGVTASDTARATVSGDEQVGSIDILEPVTNDAVGSRVVVSGVATLASNAAPVADFGFSVSGSVASFDASASSDPDGDVLVLAWAFGDGAVGEGAQVSHAYAAPGSYEACLTVSDGSLTDELCKTVAIGGSGGNVVATDPEGDARNPTLAGTPAQGASVDALDITKLTATKTSLGEPVFTLTLRSMPSATPPTGEGADGASWRVVWDGPAAAGLDFVQFSASITETSCGYGDNSASANLYQEQGTAVCTFTPGTPATITMTYPLAAMAARGYTGGETLYAVKGESLVYRGIPKEAPVSAGSTSTYDQTTPGEHALAGSFPAGLIGVGKEERAKSAPSTPPADPEITDKVVEAPFETIPHINVQSGWFDSDADNLYVGLKVQDVPADTATTAFIYYSVNFKPDWQLADTTWGGKVPGTSTFQGLRAMALLSPVSVNDDLTPRTDTATQFELQVLSASSTGSNFATVDIVEGSVDPATDIVWWTIPRELLQNPGGGDTLIETSAIAAAAIGGLVSFNQGDSTGTGDAYTFPQLEVSQPIVTLAATPASGIAPLAVTFALGVTPANVATWQLDFGDGTEPATGIGSLPATLEHVYTASGDHQAVLTVVAPDNGQGTATAAVTVGSVPTGGRVVVAAPGVDPVEATCSSGCASWSAELDLSALADGETQITATLYQDGSVIAADDVLVWLEKVVTISIDSPLDNSVVGPGPLAVSGRLATQNDLRPVAYLAADSVRGEAPFTVTFSLDGDDDRGVASWSFNSGNGLVTSGTSLPATVVREYETGSYTATLSVTDTAGQVDSTSLAITATTANLPPLAPHTPSPASGATGRAMPVVLSWQSSDPNGDPLTFDVYLDSVDGSTLVATDQTAGYIAGGLTGSTTYYWKVVAKDGIASTEGPVWSFTTAAPVLGEESKAHVVVALIDSGTNPYHQDFRRPGLVAHPSTYLSGFPASAVEVDLCFYDAATKTVDSSRCTGSPTAMATGKDLTQWQKFDVSPTSQVAAGQGNIAWFPGTNVLLVSFGHAGNPDFPGLDGTLGAGDSHGTATSSNVGGATTGTCPECIFVMIEGDDVPAIQAAYQWAANQPWIDVITSSVSIGLIGVGANPADFFDASSQATRTAVTNGKIVFEAAGNGVANAGLAPMSTFLYANSNPWTIPVGCSAEHSGQACFYHDFPNAVTASGASRTSAQADSYTGTGGIGGTSFSSPSTAGVTARALYAARVAMNDVAEGPSASGTKSLLRVGPGATAPSTGPFADGSLTKLELEETLFKTARRTAVPALPYYFFPVETPNSPAGFVKEGFGNVYRGDWGVGHPTAQSTWSSSPEVAAVILGDSELPARWVEEFWWESIVQPIQVSIFGAEPAETDVDAFPRNDAPDPTSILGYQPEADLTGASQRSADVPVGHVPTAANRRVYLHASDLVEGTPELYLNTIADPTGGDADCTRCADMTGYGMTGVVPAGAAKPTMSFEMRYPTVEGVLALDGAKDVTVHVEATRLAAAAPATAGALRYVLTADGAVVGAGAMDAVKRASDTVYEAKFRPAVTMLADPVVLHLSWDGPAASVHLQTQGQSWMDLPVAATLAAGETTSLVYYADDLDAVSTNGDTVDLTLDATKLAGDADAGSYWPFPQASGLVVNFVSEQPLADEPTLLASAGAADIQICTNPQTPVGAASVTATVQLYAGPVNVGGGSATQTLAGPQEVTPMRVPLSLKPILLPEGVPLQAVVKLAGPGGVFTENMGFCGGGPDHPWTFTVGVTELGVLPTLTANVPDGTLSGTKTISGTATFPAIPSLGSVTWHVKDFDRWANAGETLTMDTNGPGTDSGGPFLDPDPDGFDVRAKSARPVAADAPALADQGVGTVQFWITAVGAATDVTVDMTVLLEDAAGDQRLLGQGAITKHVMPPLGAVAPFWDEKFVLDFVPAATDPQPDEKLVLDVKITNLGPAADTRVTCWCGDDVRPVFVTLPTPLSPEAVDPRVRLQLGNLVAETPVVGGAWTIDVDTTAVENGARTLTLTPVAEYGGAERTGMPVQSSVTVSNLGQNTPPTATLGLTPTSGFAPLSVTATLDGSDAQTLKATLQWEIAWGDGATDSGVGLPATTTHVYETADLFVATLTVTDAGNDVATASVPVTAMQAPPTKKVVVLLDGVLVGDATATSGDYARWTAEVGLSDAGMHAITARHVRGDEVLSEATVSVTVELPNLPDLEILTPGDGARIAGGSLTGRTAYDDEIASIVASLDPAFGTSVPASTSDGYRNWSVDLAQLALPEDAETNVYVLATSPDGNTTAFRAVTLDAAPNAAILVTPPPPVDTLVALQFDASASPSATGAAVNGFAWTFGDGATSVESNPTHTYAHGGEYTVTLTVTDVDGATGTAERTLLVKDRAPVVGLAISPELPTTLDTVTLDATASDPEGTATTLETTVYDGTTKDAPVLASGGASVSLQFPDDGQFLVVAAATDGDGGYGELQTLVTVYNVRPVAALTADPLLVGVGQDVTFDASGSSDPDGTVVEYRFDPGDGSPVVTQDTPQVVHQYETNGLFYATVTVVDDDGSEITSAPVAVKANAGPVLAAIGHKLVDEGQALSFTATATDPENDALTFTLTPLPSGATFDGATGAFSWTPAYGQNGNYPVTVSVTDGRLTDSEELILSVGDVNLPPTLVPIGAKSVVENSQLAFQVDASDPDTPLSFGASPLPTGAIFDEVTGAFVWTPGFSQAGIYTVLFTVDDGLTQLTELVTITVANNDRLPVLNAISNVTVYQGSPVDIAIQASDADGELISFAHTGPAGVVVSNQGNGRARLQWTPGTESLGLYPITVFATAGEGAASREFTVRVLFKAGVSTSAVSPATAQVSPGEVRTLVTRVTNTGPNADTFRIAATNTQGWELGAYPNEVSLASGASIEVPIAVTVNGNKPLSWTTVTATSLGDPTVSRSTGFRLDVPVLIEIDLDDPVAGLLEIPVGVVRLTHLDGTVAPAANVRIIQTPDAFGSLRSQQSGVSDEAGEFAFDFSQDPKAMVPGPHKLQVVASKPGGYETVVTVTYTISAVP